MENNILSIIFLQILNDFSKSYPVCQKELALLCSSGGFQASGDWAGCGVGQWLPGKPRGKVNSRGSVGAESGSVCHSAEGTFGKAAQSW